MREGDLASALALAAAAGPWEPRAIADRLALALDRAEAPWMRSLARRLCSAFAEAPLELEDLAAQIALAPGFHRAWLADRRHRVQRASVGEPPLRVRRWYIPEARMGARPFDVPALATPGELARLVELPPDELDWMADPRGMNRAARDAKLHHYLYRWIAKRSGGHRLIEAPKYRLKRAQRLLLDRILAGLPAHPTACGFVPGRSVLDHARAHVGRRVVVRLDLESFFWSVPPGRVYGLFRFLGYPPSVARLSTGLATTRTPRAVISAHPGDPGHERFAVARRLAHRHLPQGAPTSGALASACAWSLDRRLAGLAACFDASYSRYADDLAFSGDAAFERDLARFLPRASAIAIEEGFAVRYAKTRVMRSSQRQELCGVVVNERPSLPRRELERLEAILVNCIRHGPATQNRDNHPDFRAHLVGRVAWVRQVVPDKARGLEALLARVEGWPLVDPVEAP